MTYVITQPCEDLKDATCVEVCPVECIKTTPEARQYYIDPEICIECEQCAFVCPVDAIFIDKEVPAEWTSYIDANTLFFQQTKEMLVPLPLEQAEQMLQAVYREAAEVHAAVGVAVVDKAGELILAGHMDSAPPDSEEAAVNKAFTSAYFQLPTHEVGPRLQRLDATADVPADRLVAVPGGLTVLTVGFMVGAIGVAGGSPEQNIRCARAGLAAFKP